MYKVRVASKYITSIPNFVTYCVHEIRRAFVSSNKQRLSHDIISVAKFK